jgi:hypothetical protein
MLEFSCVTLLLVLLCLPCKKDLRIHHTGWMLLLVSVCVPFQVVAGGALFEASAQSSIDVERAARPELHATRTEEPIVIDGRLDEPVWERAEMATGFIQSFPATGAPATERTVARVVYDDENLYIGAVCYDSEPDRIFTLSLRQDFESHNSDVFGITLDTFLDRRNAFMFLINPGGALWEAQNFNDSRHTDVAWEGIVELKTLIHDEGWNVEFAIPLSTLRFDPGQPTQSWGLNFLRRVRRKNEDAYWAPLDKRNRLHRMSRAGTLHGLKGLRGGRNLSIKPYGLAAREKLGSRGGDPHIELNAGLDAKYGITSGLTLDLTYRTDFSQVEVDQEQINLTRFPLFFPEKRDFFIENSGIFNFGDLRERNYRTGSTLKDFTLFHSRRIGLDNEGRPIPIVGGGRLTGRTGAYEFGVLDMQTRSDAGLPPENFAVARIRRNVGSSDLGAILINRQATSGPTRYNRSFGVDANIRPFRNLVVNSYIARTEDSQVEGDSWAGRVYVGWRDSIWDTSFFLKHVGDAFLPRVGFVRRRGIRHGYATIGAHPRPNIPHVQEMNPYAEIHYITNLDGDLETRTESVGLGYEFLDGGRLNYQINRRFEQLFEVFEIHPGVRILPGSYEFWEGIASYRSAGSRSFSGEVALSWGEFFNGDKTTLDLSARWRPNPHWMLEVFGQRNNVVLPQDTFTADVYGLRLDLGFTTRVFFDALIQYNAAIEETIVNLRFNIIHSALSDLFVVYNERRNVRSGNPIDQVFTVKVTRLFAF